MLSLKRLSQIIILAVVLNVAVHCFALSCDEVFFQANKSYADANYENAIKLYEDIIQRGYENGNIYYNLGNAYFKTGEKGKALLNYYRAKKFMPQDEDLFANIKFLESLLELKQPEEMYSWYEKIYFSILSSFSATTWFFMGLLFLWAGIVFIAYLIFGANTQKNAKMIVMLIFCFCLVCNFFFYKSYKTEKNITQGIVIVPATEVRYSPSYSGAVAFKITEGMKAQILHVEKNWAQIRLNKKTSGWIESAAIEQI